MRLNHARRSSRPSFTLVELMIVIAIISVLISLISAAVWKSLVVANRTRNRSEIAQMASALETFKSRYGFYPPPRLMLAEKLSFYPANPNPQQRTLAEDSIQTLLRMFPRAADRWNNPGIDWNGTRTIDNGITILEGDQCLVFFLGGIPDNFSSSPNCTGFSTNALDPASHINNSNVDTLPPFFEFDSTRLVRLPGRPPNIIRSPLHYSYLDTYRIRPYAYFSSGNSRDDYNRYVGPPPAWYPPPLRSAYGNSDCRSLFLDPTSQLNPQAVWPYAEAFQGLAKPRYFNPNSFQIISAGADGMFGPGTFPTLGGGWTGFPVSGPYSNGQPGYDDQSNFRESTVGSGT